MKPLFLKARIKNMTTEFVRLSKFMFTPHHIKIEYRLMGEHKTIETTDGRMMRNNDEEWGLYLQPVDAFDRCLSVVTNIFSTYWGNVVKHENCSHPHAHVYEEWEGDREFGYCRQMYCSKCGGYLLDNEIDRYEVERNLEGYVHSHRPKEVWEDEAEDRESAYDPYGENYYYYE